MVLLLLMMMRGWGTSFHGFHGIFNLEDVPIRAGCGLDWVWLMWTVLYLNTGAS